MLYFPWQAQPASVWFGNATTTAMNDLDAKIAQLEALRASLGDAPVDAALAALRGTPPPSRQISLDFGSQNRIDRLRTGDLIAGDKISGAIHVDADAHISGVAVGVNLGTIIFGRSPEEDERRRLVWYLARLAADLDTLELRGLDPAADQRVSAPALSRTYVMLATTNRVVLNDSAATRDIPPERHPDYALPDRAILAVRPVDRADLQPGEPPQYEHVRALLAVEAARRHPRLVVLGEPGSGKTTFLRYLARMHALLGLDQRGIDGEPAVWPGQPSLVPVRLALPDLARRLAGAGTAPATIQAAIGDAIAAYGIDQVHDLVNALLHSRRLLLLLDALDEALPEVSAAATGRATILQAIRAFGELHQISVVLTCRKQAFGSGLRSALPWPVEELAPWTGAQIGELAQRWYAAAAMAGDISHEQAQRLAYTLGASISASPRLRELAASPLHVTMMALVLRYDGRLQRDRPLLYERMIKLLLGERHGARPGQDIGAAVGLADWDSDRFLALLDELAFQAHTHATDADDRGRITRIKLRDGLIDFFERAQVAEPWDKADRCREYLVERAALLHRSDQEEYRFAHQTLQEFCAGRYLALQPDAAGQLLHQRRAPRWREPILLGIGFVQRHNPYLVDRVLNDLVDRYDGESEKPDADWQHDLLLAAEIGADRDWGDLHLRGVNTAQLKRRLREGLVAVLAGQALAVDERITAGRWLGGLEDPRMPVTPDAWRAATRQHSEGSGAPDSYWCYVLPGVYRVGGWQRRLHAASLELPAFWIARFPVTVAQFAAFRTANGYANPVWWTPHGWQWLQAGGAAPVRTGDLADANRPVDDLSWYEATAFAAWLTELLRADLPAGYVVRLPTEAEWEVAAAYDGPDSRRDYPWGQAPPDPERLIYAASYQPGPAPVGTCPGGAAACGALDLAGNVWEWTASAFLDYPARSAVVLPDSEPERQGLVARGGAFWSDARRVGCAAQTRCHPDDQHGLRLALAPAAA